MDFIFFLGRFHVLVLHLPIGMICALFLLEWLSRKEKYRYLEAASPFLWTATAVSAVVTVALGFMHFAEGSFTGPSGNLHRLFGTIVAVVATAVAVLRISSKAASLQRAFLPASLVLVVLVAATGHYGGNLTHGSTYLVEYAPQFLRSMAGLEARRTVTSVSTADPFADVVGPMLNERCASCHNEDKAEADLTLTTYAAVMRGGESGGVVIGGNPEGSELLRRITLPESDEAFMPAEGKTPLTAEQVEIIQWWISVGAPNGGTVGELDVPPALRDTLTRELGVGF
jgi:uncharacterized membrane protein